MNHTPSPNDPHTITLRERVTGYEDGLLLGNGDLSVSVYQKSDQIVWRFGKGDVWDRRHDISADCPALTLDELRHGIEVEGWKAPPYGGEVTALRGTKDPKRMKDCLARPQSQKRPYPMPKPVGELALHWPPDLQELKIEQTLIIEEARIEITCSWPDGEKLFVECFIPPSPNVLCVRWRLDGFDSGAPQAFHKAPPIRLTLYRWSDPPFELWNSQYWARNHYAGMTGCLHPTAVPLPPPEVATVDGLPVIQQRFYADPLFTDGFRYWLGCLSSEPHIEHIKTGPLNEAQIRIAKARSASFENLLDMSDNENLQKNLFDYVVLPPQEGWIIVPVTTSSDPGGCDEEYRRIRASATADPDAAISAWRDDTIAAARRFWSASSVSLSETAMEKLWYDTLHATRCVYRGGTVPPGMFLPSTVDDYSNWKGDYHTQYNLIQPFWGVHAANHAELAEAYFAALSYIEEIGRKIARDYCGTRGLFVQINGYPIKYKDDPYATGPMGRMPYMTGWVAEIFWSHYLYTQDKDFLRDKGYPFIRDCALFYTDFVKKGTDGLYHAFPSSFGEEGYNGDPATNTDVTQTIDYIGFCLRMALRAAHELGADPDLQAEWQDRIAHLAPGRGDNEFRALPQAREPRHQEFNPPDFRPALLYRFNPEWNYRKKFWGWIDKLIRQSMQDIRGGVFQPERDFADWVAVVRRWRHPNGLLWAMPVRFFGHAGAWTETLGIIAPLQEMMLQSWDGVIRVFPCWPSKEKARFNGFRAEGAFLVSAAWADGSVTSLDLTSLAGRPCTVANPWPGAVVQISGVGEMAGALLEFPTQAGCNYSIARSGTEAAKA